MKVVKLIVRAFVVCGIVGASGYFTQKTVDYVRRIDDYSITITGNITERVRADIAQHVQTSWPMSDSSFAQLCAAAQEEFACIKDLDIALLPGKKAHVEISVHEPLYAINNDHVVTHDGVLLAKNIYEPQAVQDLYQIFISGLEPNSSLASTGLKLSPDSQSISGAQVRKTLSPTCRQSLAQVAPGFLDRYIFAWQNENAAWLYARDYNNNAQLAILFHPLSIPADKTLEQCNLLRQDLMSQKLGKNQQIHTWVADVRFKDQIIVSANNKMDRTVAMGVGGAECYKFLPSVSGGEKKEKGVSSGTRV